MSVPVKSWLVAALVAGVVTAGCGGPNPKDDLLLCRTYQAAEPSARAPLDAMRTEAVLVPFIDYIELGTRQIAAGGATAKTREVAAAMRELTAAIDDVDAQGHRGLPPGADLSEKAVKLNPDRLAAALDGASRACAPSLAN